VEDGPEQQRLHPRLVALLLDEQRRIERGLHDGAQQDLIAISVQLQVLRGLLKDAPAEALASLDELQQQVRESLERVRSLAIEIYPAVLDSQGLPDALRQLARAAGSTARVEADDVERYPAEIEAAVIFLWRAVLDGLRPDEEGLIRLREEDGALRVEVVTPRALDLSRVEDLTAGAGGVLTVAAEPAGLVRAAFPLA
jgi:signal transduction histidine kinase